MFNIFGNLRLNRVENLTLYILSCQNEAFGSDQRTRRPQRIYPNVHTNRRRTARERPSHRNHRIQPVPATQLFCIPSDFLSVLNALRITLTWSANKTDDCNKNDNKFIY